MRPDRNEPWQRLRHPSVRRTPPLTCWPLSRPSGLLRPCRGPDPRAGARLAVMHELDPSFLFGFERPILLGGPGTPEGSEHCVCEFAAALHVSIDAGRLPDRRRARAGPPAAPGLGAGHGRRAASVTGPPDRPVHIPSAVRGCRVRRPARRPLRTQGRHRPPPGRALPNGRPEALSQCVFSRCGALDVTPSDARRR